MRKKRFALVLMALPLIVVSCMKEVYQPDAKVDIPPTDNPLGEGFSAPDDFDWSMLKSISLTAIVNDDFDGQYHYKVEIFAVNPIIDTQATPIAAGVANGKQNFQTTLTLPRATGTLYIRQTDPKQRKEVYAFTVPEQSGSMSCRLELGATTTRAAATRAVGSSTAAYEQAQADGFVEPTAVDESAFVVPAGAIKITANPDWYNYPAGSNVLIDTDTGQNLNTPGGVINIYVTGTWRPTNSFWFTANIYILKGGKMVVPNYFSFGNMSIYIQEGASIECAGSVTFGGSTLYNYGTIRGTEVVFQSGNGINCKVLSHGEIKADNFFLNGAEVYNYGELLFDETKGEIKTNNSPGTAIINHNDATVKGYKQNQGASIYNDGFIELTICEMASLGRIYNSCTLVVKEEYIVENLTMDKGSITGGRDPQDDTKWLPLPKLTCSNPNTITLKNGSLLKVDVLHLKNSPNVIVGEGTDPSMLKVKTLTLDGGGSTTVSGNLVLELGKVNGSNPKGLSVEPGIPSTGYDESKYTIETCAGILNEENPGGTPTEPTYPIEVKDAIGYTFAFEDNWPTYGDFDLNDVVVTIDTIVTRIRQDGSVQSAVVKGALQAVGASRTAGLSIRFLALGKDENITDHVHTFMGGTDNSFINVNKDAPTNRPPKEFTISLDFPDTSVKPEALNIDQLDVYIYGTSYLNKTKRKEIHVAGIAPTDKADTLYFGTGNDDSSVAAGRYYLSTERLAWAVVIPTTFNWVIEGRNIKTVYNQFESWVTSGGKDNPEWYLHHDEWVFK